MAEHLEQLDEYLHIEVAGDREVTLNEVVAKASGRGYFSMYGTIATPEGSKCHSPCDRRVLVDFDASYVIRGERVAPSREFRLPGGDEVTLHVRPRPKFLRPLGFASLGLGLFTGVTGAAMVGVDSRKVSTEETMSFDRKYRAAARGLLASGIVLLVGGIIMVATGRTRVTVE